MTTPNTPSWQEDKQESTNLYIWVVVAILAVLVLCVAIAFCGLGWWTIRNSSANDLQSESEAATQPAIDFLQEISADPEWKLLLNDEFKNNQNKWEIGPYQNDVLAVKRSIEGGKYIWDFQSKASWLFPSYPDTTSFKDFVATVEIKHLEGNAGEGFGLILRAYYNEYYLFQISEMGIISFYIYTSDKYSALMERTTSAVKIGESNQITVKVVGNHFTFYINNQLASQIEDDRLSNGYVGIFTSTSGMPESNLNVNPNGSEQTYPSKYEVDNFKVWIPVSEDTKFEALIPEVGGIVFVSDADGNPEIYSINTDGTYITRLTNNNADDISPKWSPNGSKIAFVSKRDGNPEIYTMNSDGSGITRITDDLSDDIDPAWSPDGGKLVFSSNRDGNYEIYVYDFAKDNFERMTDNSLNDRAPDWSSDGDFIIFQSHNYQTGYFATLNMATKEVNDIKYPLMTMQSRPALSPDGSWILYEYYLSEDEGIMLYHQHDGQMITFSEEGSSSSWPAWSPQGAQVAFVSNRAGIPDIYIMSKDGKALFQLTNNDAVESEIDWIQN